MIVRAGNELRLAVLKANNQLDSELFRLMPDWLKPLLMDSDILIFSKEDYDSLPSEVAYHMEVISR